MYHDYTAVNVQTEVTAVATTSATGAETSKKQSEEKESMINESFNLLPYCQYFPKRRNNFDKDIKGEI